MVVQKGCCVHTMVQDVRWLKGIYMITRALHVSASERVPSWYTFEPNMYHGTRSSRTCTMVHVRARVENHRRCTKLRSLKALWTLAADYLWNPQNPESWADCLGGFPWCYGLFPRVGFLRKAPVNDRGKILVLELVKAYCSREWFFLKVLSDFL